MKDTHLHVRLDAALKRAAERLAKAEGRTLSNWVLQLLRARVAEAKKAAE